MSVKMPDAAGGAGKVKVVLAGNAGKSDFRLVLELGVLGVEGRSDGVVKLDRDCAT